MTYVTEDGGRQNMFASEPQMYIRRNLYKIWAALAQGKQLSLIAKQLPFRNGNSR